MKLIKTLYFSARRISLRYYQFDLLGSSTITEFEHRNHRFFTRISSNFEWTICRNQKLIKTPTLIPQNTTYHWLTILELRHNTFFEKVISFTQHQKALLSARIAGNKTLIQSATLTYLTRTASPRTLDPDWQYSHTNQTVPFKTHTTLNKPPTLDIIHSVNDLTLISKRKKNANQTQF